MPTSRRALLSAITVGSLLGLTACTPDPTIQRPSSLPSASKPVPSESARLAAAQVAALRSVAAAITDAGATSAAVVAQCDTYLSRLLSLEPLSPGSPVVHPSPSPSPAPGATTADLSAAAATATAHLQHAVELAEGQPLRLLYVAIAIGVAALAKPTLAAAPSAEVPAEFEPVDLENALGNALNGVRTLIHGLELALARLDSDSPVSTAARSRLGSAKTLRNSLWDTLSDVAPEQPVSYAMPNAMSTETEIAQALASLEQGVLDRLALLVAADEGDSTWFAPMLTQLSSAQASGAKIDVWPGWV